MMNAEVTSAKLNSMVKDTLGMALLDSGCTKTVERTGYQHIWI